MLIDNDLSNAIQELITSIEDNTRLEFVSCYNQGISDRMKCSQCEADIIYSESKKQYLSDVDHESDCIYILAQKVSNLMKE